MSASAYLVGTDLEAYGVPTATPAQVQRASALIDAYLKRPEGCVWMPDAQGLPCYMVGLDPTMTLTPAAPISPGAAVVVSIPGLAVGDEVLGEVVILDRGKAGATEACVIQAFTAGAAGQLTLQTVTYPHDAGFTMDFGLVVTEEKPMPNQRSLVHLSQWPISRPLSGVGRYGYGRRSDQMLGYFDDVNLLSMFSSFGGPPAWELFEIQASSLNPITGQYWVPAGVLLSYFTDVKIRYVGGWQASALPRAIKVATASLVEAIADAGLGPQVRKFSTGKIDIERFSATVLDDDTRDLLRPYRAHVLG